MNEPKKKKSRIILHLGHAQSLEYR
jgi:hypothetical protein